ncbi:hypothetical protein HZC35_00240 [Candidatus Saganbacteria bacterium]|nr:hypothetical protein [Candidatus Saganbacteria bacterium]
MPDPIQTICSRLPGAVYNQTNDTCRYSEQGNLVLISRSRNGVLSITAVGNSTAAPAASPSTPPRTGRSKLENIGISQPAMSRLNEIQMLLANHPEGLSPEMVEQLNSELKFLQQALRLGCDIRIALKLLDEPEVDLDALAEMISRITDNLNARTLSSITPEARAALCILFNDPNVDLPSIPDELWNSICE